MSIVDLTTLKTIYRSTTPPEQMIVSDIKWSSVSQLDVEYLVFDASGTDTGDRTHVTIVLEQATE